MVSDVGTTVFFVRIHHTINIRLSLLILNEKRPISFSSASGSNLEPTVVWGRLVPKTDMRSMHEKLKCKLTGIRLDRKGWFQFYDFDLG